MEEGSKEIRKLVYENIQYFPFIKIFHVESTKMSFSI